MIASLITQIAAAPKTHSARFTRTKIEFQLPGKCRHKLKLNSRDVISAYNFARRKTVKITGKNKKKSATNPAPSEMAVKLTATRKMCTIFPLATSASERLMGAQMVAPWTAAVDPELPVEVALLSGSVDGLLSRACWQHLGIAGSFDHTGRG